jgi:hypothetical protein
MMDAKISTILHSMMETQMCWDPGPTLESCSPLETTAADDGAVAVVAAEIAAVEKDDEPRVATADPGPVDIRSERRVQLLKHRVRVQSVAAIQQKGAQMTLD